MKLFDSNSGYMLEQFIIVFYILINVKCEKSTRSINFWKQEKIPKTIISEYFKTTSSLNTCVRKYDAYSYNKIKHRIPNVVYVSLFIINNL